MEIMTKAGREKLKHELKRLEKEDRPALAKRLRAAISYGDLSENAEYADAKDEQAKLEARIAELKQKLRQAHVPEGRETIHVGSTFEATTEGAVKTFSLVGKEEANPLEGKISFDSPIGSAFVDKKEGDIVEVATPAGKKIYTVAKII